MRALRCVPRRQGVALRCVDWKGLSAVHGWHRLLQRPCHVRRRSGGDRHLLARPRLRFCDGCHAVPSIREPLGGEADLCSAHQEYSRMFSSQGTHVCRPSVALRNDAGLRHPAGWCPAPTLPPPRRHSGDLFHGRAPLGWRRPHLMRGQVPWSVLPVAPAVGAAAGRPGLRDAAGAGERRGAAGGDGRSRRGGSPRRPGVIALPHARDLLRHGRERGPRGH
mmetsp:Transcript_47481/g.149201  ORF Transcript_47481/g.149201 Transcript_47481/m.149201 type:complete len:221 (-) Transcript_47481:163-825(-)